MSKNKEVAFPSQENVACRDMAVGLELACLRNHKWFIIAACKYEHGIENEVWSGICGQITKFILCHAQECLKNTVAIKKEKNMVANHRSQSIVKIN